MASTTIGVEFHPVRVELDAAGVGDTHEGTTVTKAAATIGVSRPTLHRHLVSPGSQATSRS